MFSTEIIPVSMRDGTVVMVESRVIGEELVASRAHDFQNVSGQIRAIAGDLIDTLKQIGPDSASIEFGFEISVDSGGLTAILVKGSAAANIKVTLGWTKDEKDERGQDA